MIKWLNTHLPANDSYVDVIIPRGMKIITKDIKKLINHPILKFKNEDYNKLVKYKLCFNNALAIDLVLSLENTIKDLCSRDPKLAAAYTRGMMIGEGTAYFGKSRYVRIEMRNEKEIKYLHRLLAMLGYDCKPLLRSTRHNMWSLYIGAKQLDKFAKEIGFGVHAERQRILEKGATKVLRVNQYG